MTRNNLLIGILFGAAGVAALSSMDAVAKALGASIPTAQIVFVRYAGAAIWLTLFILVTRKAWPTRASMGGHTLRGVLMAVTAFFFFYGVTHLPLAIALALAMSAPIYVSLLSVVFLREPFSITLLLAIGLGVTGSLVIVFGGGEPIGTQGTNDALAWAAAILAPFTYATALVLMKHHSTNDSPSSMSLAQSAIAALAVAPFSITSLVEPQNDLVWLQTIAVGFLGAVGFLLLLSGLRRLPASTFATIDYTAILWAAALGYVFFGEGLETRLFVGGGMIISACILGMRAANNTVQTTKHVS